MRVYEETWEATSSRGSVTQVWRGDGGLVADVHTLDADSGDHGKLVEQAPAMARLLVELDDDKWCHWCGRNTEYAVDHSLDCKLTSVLRAAGVIT